MALTDLSQLDRHSVTGFPPGSLPTLRTFFSPVDDVHGALVDLVKSASQSLVVAMYGFDDQELADALLEKLHAEHVFVQFTLDSSQARGVHEKRILAQESYPASSLAVGESEKGAIIHLKMVVIDGLDVVTGSTNWSASGESLQDNQLTIVRDPLLAAKSRARIDAIHAHILARAGAGNATGSLAPSPAPGVGG